MKPIKTYTATIKITFDAYEKENPRMIAGHMANYYNSMRGANLYSYGSVEKIVKEFNKKNPKSKKFARIKKAL